MAAFVLDASVAISWCFPGDPTQNTPCSRAILEYTEEADAIVPEIWPFEIANGIFVAYSKRKRIAEICKTRTLATEHCSGVVSKEARSRRL